MNASIALNPGYWFASAGKQLFGKFAGKSGRLFVRNHYRKWCVDQELPVLTRWGFKMLASPHDYASYGIYFFGEYDPRMSDVIRHIVRPGMITLDIGAERGWFTLLMGRLAGPGGAVHAFEAFPDNAARLRENVRVNQYAHVNVHAMAVSDSCGTVHFQPPSFEAAGSKSFLSDCSGVGYISQQPSPASLGIPSISLDAFAQQQQLSKVDFIKMDIEGAEVSALRGAHALLTRSRPVIAIEYNRATLRRAGTSMEELDQLLDQYNYQRLVYDGIGFKPANLALCANKPDEYAVFNVYAFPRS